VSLGVRIDDWRVCWLGGWDKCRIVFVVMVFQHRQDCLKPSLQLTKAGRNNKYHLVIVSIS
jgi:hypothetical protein